MGCSPSKGNFAALGSMRKGRMLPAAPSQAPRGEGDGQNLPGTTNEDVKNKVEAAHCQVFQKEAQVTPQKKRNAPEQVTMEAVSMDKVELQPVNNGTVSHGKDKNFEKQDVSDKRPNKKPKKTAKAAKGPKKKEKEKDKDKDFTDQKVDFPEPLVKAHQAAYAFLNPSINKYDDLLGLLEEATQTQVHVQPMVAFMALRYEEVIQGLEEMADEGEKVLRENGENLAWPSPMKNLLSSTSLKSNSASTDPPPDLLQQLLQYTTQRMRNVSHTVGGIGDSALEEAVEYFASVSELLELKLKVKRSLEARLMRLLNRIEMASLRKPGPEDSALFSEDSGIGAENESLAGSEKRHRRESCGSTGTSRSTSSPIEGTSKKTLISSRQNHRGQISPTVSLTSLNSLGSVCTIMPNDQQDSLLGSFSLDDGEDEDEEQVNQGMQNVKVSFRTQADASSADSERNPRRLPPKRIENPQNVEMTLKMKKAISGRIQFVPKQPSTAKAQVTGSPKIKRHDWTDEEVRSPKRPQTAAPVRKATVKSIPATRGQRSRSAESLRSKGEDPTLLELERTQKELNQKLQKLNKNKVAGNSKVLPLKPTQRNSPAQSPATSRKNPSLDKDRNSKRLKEKASPANSTNKKEEQTNDVDSNEQKDEQPTKFPLRAPPTPSPPSSPRPSSGLRRGRNSVKKLIDTFSQGIEELEGPKVLGPLKGVRRCGVPVLPGLGNVEAVLSSGITSCRPEPTTLEKTDYLDLDNLPPPPLEVLMDKSFESVQNGPSTTGDGVMKVGKSPVLKRAGISQRLKASLQSGTVLPSKGGLPQSSKVILPTKIDNQEMATSSKVCQQDLKPETEPEGETNSLFQQARKIIHLKKSADSNSANSLTNSVCTPNNQRESTNPQHSGIHSVPGPNSTTSIVPASAVTTTQPSAISTVSRGRILPTAPSTTSSLQYKLPGALTFKAQSSSPTAASPPVHRALPTPPGVQRRLPSPPVGKQTVLNSNPSPSYSFKAPSPPASPKIHRLSRESSSEDLSSSRMFSNARSVFCPVSPSMFEAKPCPIPKPPQAWTSTRVSFISSTWENRGRFPVSVQGPRLFVRRSQSDRRPSLNLPPQSQGISVAETCGSEPVISSHGLDDEPIKDEDVWGSQSELRGTLRSASHPDLCVVGQGLHRD